MKYKYSRKEIAEKISNKNGEIYRMLLAKKCPSNCTGNDWCSDCANLLNLQQFPKSQPKIEKIEDGCKDVTIWIKQLWKKQCEIIDYIQK